jgi:parvulin-like peptidyl-prolyl isomerase
MKSLLKLTCCLMAAAALGAAAATDDSKPAASNAAPSIDQLLPDVVIARGKGFEIKRSQLDQAIINARANAASRGQEIPAEQIPLLEKQALDDMILLKLLNSVATADQKAEAQREAETNFAQMKKQWPTEELMVRQLKASGLTPDSLRARLAEQATASTVLAARVNVTDADIEKFYEDNPSQMEQGEKASVSFITVGGPDPVTGTPLTEDQKAAKRKQIEDLRDRARKGEDFAKLAQEYSEDTASKDSGGKITLVRGMKGVPPEFEAAAFTLGTNEVSDVITTPYGFHIIKLNELIPARKATLAEATPDIKRYLEAVGIRKLLPQYFAELKKGASVEILDAQLKDSDVPPASRGGGVDMIPPDSKPADGATK